METFAPGDRVVAINADMSGPINGPADPTLHTFQFPDGPLCADVVYHVAAASPFKNGGQGIYLTGKQVYWGPKVIPWHSSRFRKVQKAGHPPVAAKEERPMPHPQPLPITAPKTITC